jgi:CheY-like chemotaxis protein
MPKRILLVEDEEDNLTLLVHILKFLLGQEQLYIAKDGHEAMMLAYQQRPDLVLLDLSLPKLDGWETVRSLRADEAFRAMPIIALTAHAMSGDREKALDAGCSDYFTKPIDIDRFIRFITPYLAETSPPASVQASPQADKSAQAPVAAQPAESQPTDPLDSTPILTGSGNSPSVSVKKDQPGENK